MLMVFYMQQSTTVTASGCATVMTGPCLSESFACLPVLYHRGKTPIQEKARVSPFESLLYESGTAFLFMSVAVLLLCLLEYINLSMNVFFTT